jgi:hypothetical protein
MSLQREFQLTFVLDGNRVGSSWSLKDGAKGTLESVFDVDTHFVRSVVRALPQGNIRLQRTSIRLQDNVNALYRRVRKRPCLEGSSLDGDSWCHVGDEIGRSDSSSGKIATISGCTAVHTFQLVQTLFQASL